MKYGLYTCLDGTFYLQLVDDYYHKLLPSLECQTKAGKKCLIARDEILHTILADDSQVIGEFKGQENGFTV